ncbi:MAG TPA: hypothetical protein VIY71_10835, partial [Solirubrobacterales bacterium]
LIVTIEGQISPKALPKKTPAPISLSVSGSLKSADGTHPPALKELFLQFDRHGQLNTTGLASCRPQRIQSTLTQTAKRVCARALIGSGVAEAEIALPEQAPFRASGPLLIFNGPPKGKKQVLVFHVYAHVPAPTTFVTTAEIAHTKGKYGTTAKVKIPTIVAGQGSLTSFKAKIQKTFGYKGKRQKRPARLLPHRPPLRPRGLLLRRRRETGGRRGEKLYAKGMSGKGKLLFALGPCFALGLAACGGGSSTQSAATTEALRGPKPAKGASALERQVYRNFQPPQPSLEAPGSAKAIQRGEAACEGRTPKQIVDRFAAEAMLTKEQREALKQIGTAEAHPTADFAAGQLAALAYEGTLAEDGLANYGYRGCVYALARGLERRLGP